MGPNELVRPRVVAPGGIWQPPIVRNGNLLLRTGTTGHMFLFDGNGVRQAGPVDACRQAYPLQEYRTTSIYYDHSRFWVLPGDATSLAAPTEEWGSIGFDWNRNLGRWCSYIERNGEKTELQLQRNDQEWVKKLLPRDYRAATVLNDPRYGGLIGDLTLILGLVAFSVPYGNVAGALSHCLRDNRWRGPVNNNHGGCKSVGNENQNPNNT